VPKKKNNDEHAVPVQEQAPCMHDHQEHIRACLEGRLWLARLAVQAVASWSQVKNDHPSLFGALAQSSRPRQRSCLFISSELLWLLPLGIW
jgi:hypothetical protein